MGSQFCIFNELPVHEPTAEGTFQWEISKTLKTIITRINPQRPLVSLLFNVVLRF